MRRITPRCELGGVTRVDGSPLRLRCKVFEHSSFRAKFFSSSFQAISDTQCEQGITAKMNGRGRSEYIVMSSGLGTPSS